MLKKLLKYDLRAIFKYWWIVALSSFGISFIGGAAMKIMMELSLKPEPEGGEVWLIILSMIGMLASIFGMCAFLIASEIFIYVRLYKHFFSDEGYLTFTLPVKRCDLLNSKLLSGVIMTSATFILFALEILIFLMIGLGTETFFTIWEAVAVFIGAAFDTFGATCLAFVLEILIILICLVISSYLMISVCITFAAIIAKKYKIFAAIGIYYLASAIASFGAQIAIIFGSISLAGILSSIPSESISGILALILLAVTLVCMALTAFLYTVELYMLDKKLNLS